MKTTKKIFAAFLAVMMIALMIPFAANAASYSYKITGKEGYVFSVYKLAEGGNEPFSYNTYVNDNIKSILTTNVNNAGVDSAALLAAADNLSDADLSGISVDTITGADTSTKTVPAGVYYVKATTTPDNVTEVRNSVFALPYNDEEDGTIKNSITLNAGNKVKDKTPQITKIFTNASTATEISEFIGKDISFTLTSTITGSDSLKLKSYVITDTMSKGLDSAADKVASVTLKGKDAEENDIKKVLNKETDYTVEYKQNDDNNTLTITVAEAILNGSEFYTYSDVEVVYTAKLNNNAIKGYDPDDTNTNVAKLIYKNNAGKEDSKDTNVLKVYTFELPVSKVNGNTGALITTSPAKFTLYTDEACTTVATNGTERETVNGVVSFSGLKADKYFLKETAAPTGYNINSSVFTVVISDQGVITVNDAEASGATVNDYPLTVPQTGGAGTIMFTIGGIVLIACAGVLLLVVMRKKASK